MKINLSNSLVLLCCLTLSSCGFQLRSAKHLPPELHELCLITPKPNSSFTHKLTNMLTSLGLKIDESCKEAPYQLQVYSTSLTRDNPAITNADQALTFNYTFNLDFELRNHQGKAIISRRTLAASRQVILNAQQVYTSYNGGAIQKQLEQIILSQVFDQLTIRDTKTNFAKYPSR